GACGLIGGSGVYQHVVAAAIGFIEQPQAFHHEVLGTHGRGALGTAAFKIDFEVSGRPGQHLIDGFVAFHRAVGGVADLAIGEENFAQVLRPSSSDCIRSITFIWERLPRTRVSSGAARAIFSSTILSITRLIRDVASFRKNGFSSVSKMASCKPSLSLISVLLASRMMEAPAVEGRLFSFSAS